MAEFLIRYVALGDSTGVGVGAGDGKGGYVERLFQKMLTEQLPVGLLNLCRNGATSGSILSEQLPRALKAKPTLVTFHVGVNDLWRGTTEQAFAENVERALFELKGTGTRALVINLPDLSHAPVAQLVPVAAYGLRLLSFNRTLKDAAARHGFEHVDLFSASRAVLADHPEYFSADGFHPSEHGYEQYVEQAWPALSGLASAQLGR